MTIRCRPDSGEPPIPLARSHSLKVAAVDRSGNHPAGNRFASQARIWCFASCSACCLVKPRLLYKIKRAGRSRSGSNRPGVRAWETVRACCSCLFILGFRHAGNQEWTGRKQAHSLAGNKNSKETSLPSRTWQDRSESGGFWFFERSVMHKPDHLSINNIDGHCRSR